MESQVFSVACDYTYAMFFRALVYIAIDKSSVHIG